MNLCSCGNKATAEGPLHLCADNSRKRTLHLCTLCDVALNLHMLRLLGDPEAGEKIAKYAATILPQTPTTN